MKMPAIVKKNKLILAVALAYAVLWIVSPDKALKSVGNSVYYLIEMLQVLPVIFLLTVVIDALIPKEFIMRGLGEKSGIKGNLLALILGSISAGPVYAAFPISKMLLGKGASVANIVVILSSWAVIKLPMLANEAKFLGVNFMVIRWILTVAAILIMAYMTAVLVKKKDILKPQEKTVLNLPVIKEEYCVGCGLCVKTLPGFYEMRDRKAYVRKDPAENISPRDIMKSVGECPTKAISYDPGKKTESA